MGITERIDRITLLTDDYRGEAPPIPKSVKIELTARCDFKCFFCASHMRLRQKSDMSWTLFSRVVREMRDLGGRGARLLLPWRVVPRCPGCRRRSGSLRWSAAIPTSS